MLTSIITGIAINALALYIVDFLISGIRINSLETLFIAALVVGIVNTFIKPVAHLISLPVTILTLGIFALIVNAAMLALAAHFVTGFEITGFWAAFFGTILLSIVSAIISGFVKPQVQR